jgi:hypothetical protein
MPRYLVDEDLPRSLTRALSEAAYPLKMFARSDCAAIPTGKSWLVRSLGMPRWCQPQAIPLSLSAISSSLGCAVRVHDGRERRRMPREPLRQEQVAGGGPVESSRIPRCGRAFAARYRISSRTNLPFSAS